MIAIDSYIRQSIPHPVYSPFFAKEAVNNGGVLEINHNYTERGAKKIIIHAIILSVPLAAATRTIVNQFGDVLLSFIQDTSMNGIYALNYVIDSPILKLTLTGGAPGAIRFNAIYQYISHKAEKGE